jgi:hypothetical protein
MIKKLAKNSFQNYTHKYDHYSPGVQVATAKSILRARKICYFALYPPREFRKMKEAFLLDIRTRDDE